MLTSHDISDATRPGLAEHDRLWAALDRAERHRGLVLGLVEAAAILCFGFAVIGLVLA